MNSRIIYLITISALLFSCEDDNESISISTDKSLYDGNESITVTIRNDSSISVWIITCPQYAFEKQEQDIWTDIYSVMCVGVTTYREIAGGTQNRDTLSLAILPTSEPISSGKYRIGYRLFEKKFVDYHEQFLSLYDLKTEEFEIKLDDVPLGAYRYTGFDSTRAAIVSGWLLFENEDSTQLSGEWSLDAIGDPANIGPQTGTGTMVGGIDNGAVWVNLNPGWADNNVLLSGEITSSGGYEKFQGTWNWSGIAGPMNQGTFSSIKEE